MIVDAHHHLWDRARQDHGWLDSPGLDTIRRDFATADLREAAPSGTTAVAVQALNSHTETLELLAAGDPVVAVVGWADLTADSCAAELDTLLAAPGGNRLRGLRHLAQDEPDPQWLLRPDVTRGLAAVTARELSFDLLVRAPQRASALTLARSLPETSFVLDHAGKPDIGAGEWDSWTAWIHAMAALPNVTCKLSGLVTECSPQAWSHSLIEPYARQVLEAFGADRVLFGSDWPVCLLEASYSAVLGLTVGLLDGASDAERAAVLGGAATRVYRL